MTITYYCANTHHYNSMCYISSLRLGPAMCRPIMINDYSATVLYQKRVVLGEIQFAIRSMDT